MGVPSITDSLFGASMSVGTMELVGVFVVRQINLYQRRYLNSEKLALRVSESITGFSGQCFNP